MPCRELEHGREATGFARSSWHVLDPGFTGLASSHKGRGTAAPQLFPRELFRQLHDETILDEADEHLPPGVSGGKSEHTTRTKAAMMFDEIGEKGLKIGSKRNRHATSRL